MPAINQEGNPRKEVQRKLVFQIIPFQSFCKSSRGYAENQIQGMSSHFSFIMCLLAIDLETVSSFLLALSAVSAVSDKPVVDTLTFQF